MYRIYGYDRDGVNFSFTVPGFVQALREWLEAEKCYCTTFVECAGRPVRTYLSFNEMRE